MKNKEGGKLLNDIHLEWLIHSFRIMKPRCLEKTK